MTEPRRFRLRVTYGLAGRLANLSHLEVTHTLERIIRRSGLPFALTCGFSPHMKLSFGSALPVGVGSTCEVFDLYLTEYVPPAKALEKLTASAPADLKPFECSYIEESAPAASCAFAQSTYEVHLSEPIEDLPIPEEIRVMRKKKEKRLAPAEFLVNDPEIEGDVLRIGLEAKDTGSLRIDVLLDACFAEMERTGLQPPQVRSITRIHQGS